MRTPLMSFGESEEDYARRLWDEEQRKRAEREAVARTPTAPSTEPTTAANPLPVSPPAPVPSATGAEADTLGDVLKRLSQRVIAGDAQSPEQREMADRWHKAEAQSLDQLTGDNSAENWAAGLGTALPLLVGTIASAATPNAYGVRGTGLGQVAQAGIANAQALLQQQQQRKAQAQGLAEAAASIRRGTSNEGFDKLSTLAARLQESKRIANQDLALGLRGTDQVMKRESQDFRLNPNDPQAVKTRELLQEFRPELRGKLDALGMDALKPYVDEASSNANFRAKYAQEIALSAGRSAASTGAQIQTESQLAPVSAETKRQTAVGAAVGSRQGEAAGRPAPVGYTVTDQAAFDNANQDQTSRTRMQTTASAGHALKTLSEGIRDMRKQYGTSVLPSAAKSQVETYKNLVIGQLNNLANAGVLNPGERQNWDKILPGLGSSGLDVISWIKGQDLSLEQLEGVVRAADGLVSTSAAPFGLQYVGVKKPAAASKPSLGAHVTTSRPSVKDFD